MPRSDHDRVSTDGEAGARMMPRHPARADWRRSAFLGSSSSIFTFAFCTFHFALLVSQGAEQSRRRFSRSFAHPAKFLISADQRSSSLFLFHFHFCILHFALASVVGRAKLPKNYDRELVTGFAVVGSGGGQYSLSPVASAHGARVDKRGRRAYSPPELNSRIRRPPV